MKTQLLVTIDFPPHSGGVARGYDEFTSRWSLSDVIVVGPRGSKSKDVPHRKILPTHVHIKWLWPHWIGLLVKVFWTLLRRDIGMIHVGDLLPSGTIVYSLTRFFRVPYIVYTHGMDLGMASRTPRKKRLAQKILSHAACVIPNSNYTLKLAKKIGGEGINAAIIHPGATTLSRAPRELVSSIQKQYSLGNGPLLLTVGRLVPRKGMDMMIRAIATLPEEQKQHLRYLIVGEGPYKAKLETLIRKHGLTNTVTLTGRLPDDELAALYELCDVFCLVSRTLNHHDVEGFGIVYLEANLFAKPVLAGNSGGVPDAVLHGKTGVLVNPYEPDDIASAIQRLINDEQSRVKMGEQGKARAQTMTWAEMTKGVEEVAKKYSK